MIDRYALPELRERAKKTPNKKTAEKLELKAQRLHKDVVKKILVQPRDPNKGEGVMKGEILKQPVKIIRASRTS